MVLSDSRFEEIWNSVLSKIEFEINDKAQFSAYFYNTKIAGIDGDTITVSVPSKFISEIIKAKYLELIQDILRETTQTNFKCIILDEEAIKNRALSGKDTDSKNINIKDHGFVTNLNPRYTFDNFVVGDKSNRESYTAALLVANNPGQFYNPLFIYGKSGLGKTHLLHAIGNKIRLNKSTFRVLYLTADDFFEEYVKAIKENEMEDLKDRFREIDVLLLDDIQFLATKEKTKETFFHIFNLLINSGKQIIITSDRHPSEIKSLEDRLVSRFAQGLSIEIKPLEYETALKILKKKIESQDINGGQISEEVLEYIASNYSGDVRQLEGALNKLLFYVITYNPTSVIDMNTVSETFKDAPKKHNENTLDANRIKSVVAEYYNISVSQLTSKLRTSNLVTARHIAMYICREMLDLPLMKIGEEFGGKDHTTVISAVEKVNKLSKENPDYAEAIKDLKKLLQNQ